MVETFALIVSTQFQTMLRGESVLDVRFVFSSKPRSSWLCRYVARAVLRQSTWLTMIH